MLAETWGDTLGRWYCCGVIAFGIVAAIIASANAKKWGLTCRRCGSLAIPIPGTRNRYRCSCGNQFAASRHNQ